MTFYTIVGGPHNGHTIPGRAIDPILDRFNSPPFEMCRAINHLDWFDYRLIPATKIFEFVGPCRHVQECGASRNGHRCMVLVKPDKRKHDRSCVCCCGEEWNA